MAEATSESDLVAALAAALDPTPVYWGWAPLDSAELPPNYPLLTVHRALFTATTYEDMCQDAAPVGDKTLVVHAWSPVYEQARSLSAAARAVILAADGWTLQSESDLFEPNVRAWQVEAQWLAGGATPD
jgi:hypothetical protein